MTLNLVKKIFLIDAATCALIFIGCVFATGLVAGQTGLSTIIVAEAGWICLAAFLLLGWIGTRRQLPIAPGWLAIVMNVGWVIASIAVFEISYDSLTMIGRVLVPLQAVGVLGFVILETMGVRAASREQSIAV